MSENLKKFMEAVSRNEEEKNTVTAMKTKEEIIAYAKDKGLTLTDEDFEQNNAELDDDELDAVAGGACYCLAGGDGGGVNDDCKCVLGGGGTANGGHKTCACVAYGQGDAVKCTSSAVVFLCAIYGPAL